jgi:hypothetical protein
VLYRPEAFEPLTDAEWDERRVRIAIREIVSDAEQAYRGDRLQWRADKWDSWHATSPMKDLYVGTAGVVWALDRLQARGHAETSLDLAAIAVQALELFRAKPDYVKLPAFRPPEPRDSSLFLGEAGILLVAWRLARDEGLADDLYTRVRANVDNPAEEVMWGSPGTLIAAKAMLDSTGDDRWRNAWNESAEGLLARRDGDGLWTQRLYGSTHRSLTPPHGFAGIARVLRLGGEPLTDAGEVARRAAVVENGRVNWPSRAGVAGLTGTDGKVRLQWCSGAPGIVIALADDLDEDLLLAAAETIWQAGPFGDEKGTSICHGTAGNGFALLKTFQRTGDELWLERARRFAVHALRQVERMPPRHSLFTGGLGAAVFAARCVEERADYPVVDSWD